LIRSGFVRVHRRTIVAIDRVRGLTPLGSGDAVIRLITGTELRVSRDHRDALRARLPDASASVVLL
jgi:two-component system LytT family response regulator